MKTLKQKIDTFLWAFMWLLPFLCYFLLAFRNPDVASDNILSSFSQFLLYHDWEFTFVKNILDNVTSTVFGFPLPINGYLSYLVGVEIAHCLFDVIVFIPRMAHAFIDWGCNLWQKR